MKYKTQRQYGEHSENPPKKMNADNICVWNWIAAERKKKKNLMKNNTFMLCDNTNKHSTNIQHHHAIIYI